MDRKIENGNNRRRLVLAIAIVAGATAIYATLHGQGDQTLRVERQRLTIATVDRGSFQEFVPVTGAIEPTRTLYLDAIEGGRVEEVYREAGSYVEAGDAILLLANTNLLMDVMFREAEFFRTEQ